MQTIFRQLHAAFHESETRIYGIVQGTVWALIVLSILLLVLEASLPVGSDAMAWILPLDQVLLSIFAVEVFLRVATFRPATLEVFHTPAIGRLRIHILARLRYMVSPLILVDLLAVLAFFPELRGLRALRLLRLLRTTRVFRYRNPFAIVLQALEENGLLFMFAFSVLGTATMLGGVSMFLIERRVNPEIESVFDGLWWALVTLTTVGYGDITPVSILGRIIGGVLMVSGMFTLALFAGIVGSSLVHGMLSIREEQFRMSEYANHVVVCGYDESTHLLLSALSNELDLDGTRVVVFDHHERPRELPPDFLWVQGNPAKESELDKVRLTHAAAVIVGGERGLEPHAADARTILISFTIRSYLERQGEKIQARRCPLYLVVEILDSENVDHARQAGADEVIETRKIGYSMIAHAVGFHGTATAMSRVLMSGEDNVYIGQIPPGLDLPAKFGDLLASMALSKRGGLVVGLRRPEGEQVINPPKSYTVEKGSLLLYLSKTPLLDPPE
jgi:voltage-gated potassium channel